MPGLDFLLVHCDWWKESRADEVLRPVSRCSSSQVEALKKYSPRLLEGKNHLFRLSILDFINEFLLTDKSKDGDTLSLYLKFFVDHPVFLNDCSGESREYTDNGDFVKELARVSEQQLAVIDRHYNGLEGKDYWDKFYILQHIPTVKDPGLLGAQLELFAAYSRMFMGMDYKQKPQALGCLDKFTIAELEHLARHHDFLDPLPAATRIEILRAYTIWRSGEVAANLLSFI